MLVDNDNKTLTKIYIYIYIYREIAEHNIIAVATFNFLVLYLYDMIYDGYNHSYPSLFT